MKKDIYITALHLLHGGVEMAISLLSNALAKQGYNVTILCVYNFGEIAYHLEPNVKIQYLTEVKPNKDELFKAIRERNIKKVLKEGFYSAKVLYLKNARMRDALKSIKNGIVISTRNEHSVLLSKYGNKDVYKIAQLHHDHEFKKKYINDFRKKYGNIDKFVLLTDEIKNEVEEMMKGYNSYTKCVTIPNFLDSISHETKTYIREKTVVSVGRLHPVKGFDRLLEIWSEVVKQEPDWKLLLIGDGDEKENLLSLAQKLGIENSVVFKGALAHEKVLDEMTKSSIYLMTSYSECFPFVLIEAMSCGLPVIAFNVRVGPRVIVKDGENGILLKDKDNIAFKDAVLSLIRDNNTREIYSKNAIDTANDFTEENIVKEWISLF